MADLKTAVSTTKKPEAYLYLSSPRFTLSKKAVSPEISMRAFASGQITTEGDLAPAYSGGLETFFGKKTKLVVQRPPAPAGKGLPSLRRRNGFQLPVFFGLVRLGRVGNFCMGYRHLRQRGPPFQAGFARIVEKR
jgi:hypothetical protein